eukprot:CAMPEP_0171100198 /NCGR_PEP_ID=MMETSP0766_2-20121228/52816_1 /TAXON_ID=439317 /ORGANISM="Gambierdiscus australes, Strain CAWD 149" /LENGTH=169 /DNA_ID=CAMNT_0011559981 /DNA_START=51 /DNA_END=560 /DNA_ORIENTATION=+
MNSNHFAAAVFLSCGLRFAQVAFAPSGGTSAKVAKQSKIWVASEQEEFNGPRAPAWVGAAGLGAVLGAGAACAQRRCAVARRTHAVKIYDTCIGCTLCVRACPTDVLEMVPATVNAAKQVASSPRVEDCVGCKRCETACPTDFLSIRVYLQENEETQYSLGLDMADWTV